MNRPRHPVQKKRRKRRSRCPSCGGLDFVTATDNHGQKYQGCARCVIKLPESSSK